MNLLVLSYLTWIGVQTGLAVPASPSIEFVSQEDMQQRSKRPFSTVVALYDRPTSTIYLPNGWKPEALYDRAMLLHELVHHVQEFNKLPSPCSAQRERQAYDLTRQWLGERGVDDPYGFLKVDELTVTILSSCPDTEALM